MLHEQPVYPFIVYKEHKMIFGVKSVQSCTIIPHSIINRYAVFWLLISFQTHGTITQTRHISTSHQYVKLHASTNAAF